MKTNFRTFERNYITAGEKTSLEGWWKAAEECKAHFTKKNGTPNRAAYADAAAKVAHDNNMDTIAKYVGYVLTAMVTINVETGKVFKMNDFKGIEHLIVTVKGKGQVKATPKKKKSDVSPAQALLRSAEFKALPKAKQALIKAILAS